jgi:hypothetical protein
MIEQTEREGQPEVNRLRRRSTTVNDRYTDPSDLFFLLRLIIHTRILIGFLFCFVSIQ